MQEYVVDLSTVATWADFVAAFNEGFVRRVGGEWNVNGSLEAFHDYLRQPDEHPYRLVVHGWRQCGAASRRPETWNGRSILEAVAQIFRENPQAEVVLTEPASSEGAAEEFNA